MYNETQMETHDILWNLQRQDILRDFLWPLSVFPFTPRLSMLVCPSSLPFLPAFSCRHSFFSLLTFSPHSSIRSQAPANTFRSLLHPPRCPPSAAFPPPACHSPSFPLSATWTHGAAGVKSRDAGKEDGGGKIGRERSVREECESRLKDLKRRCRPKHHLSSAFHFRRVLRQGRTRARIRHQETRKRLLQVF